MKQRWSLMPRTFVAAIAIVTMALPYSGMTQDQEFSGREKLRKHSEAFRKEVAKVTDGVYVAVGYSASNVTLIQGEGGSIIVDTGANPVDARAIVAAFGDRLIKPVRAIVYTHGHPDHTGGASVFAGKGVAGERPPDIYSHQLMVQAPPQISRGMRDGGDAFGTSLPATEFINAGIQLEYGRATPHTREGYLPPTQTFVGERTSLFIAGVRLEFLHTPGETDENLAIWLPDKRVLMTGDDFYEAFPNISPIRGVPSRSPEAWIASLSKMIDLDAAYVVPGHMQPVLGVDNARAALTAYRDGIRSIYDQTIEGIKQGLGPDELVQQVKLPPQLAGNRYLQEYYGGVAWMVRGIYADKVGWFDGNATQLFPLPEQARAARIVDMAGGAEKVLSRGRAALNARDFQWAAELADYLLALDRKNVEASKLKAQALTELAERQINANARNYYLTTAQRLSRNPPAE